jgi:hypothetical protein
MDRKTIIFVSMFAILAFLALAPWINNNEVHDTILQQKGHIDGTVDSEGNMICDYNVSWIPFGRWVASCEGGWFVTFYGDIFPY